ncbi:MAG: hypothetical protein ACOYOE_12920 [Chlorobium sp.]
MSWTFRSSLKTTGCITAIVIAATGMRLWLLFSTSLIPGINGGYYLVRVCALIEHGQLALI